MNRAVEFSNYRFEEYDQLCLKAGPEHPKQILLIPPLFDEMNRMRRMIVEVMHLLSDKGIGTIFPDLPGSNESLFPQEKASLTLWRKAMARCFEQETNCTHIASFRGGCLIDDLDVPSKNWRLSPAKGSSLLRTMMRTRIASDKESSITTTMAQLTEQAQTNQISLAGNIIGPEMFAELGEAQPKQASGARLVRLASDSQEADAKLPGSALWLRAEPDEDQELSAALADDIAAWANA